MVKLSIIEKYALLPKFWQRNLNGNNDSTNAKREEMDVTEEKADDQQQNSNVRSVCQENTNVDHKMGNEAGNEKAKVDYTAHSSLQNVVTEGLANIRYNAGEYKRINDPVGALISLCEFAHTQIKPLPYKEVIESSNYNILSNTHDMDTDRNNIVVGNDDFNKRDTAATALQEVSFPSSYEYTNVQGESSAMDGREMTPTGRPQGPVRDETDPTPGTSDLYNSDQENRKVFRKRPASRWTVENEVEESEDRYAGHWNVRMKNDVKMVITKSKRKMSQKEKADDEEKKKKKKKN
ncbi:uncharacterized protein [Palaemon carinicauda]|uniref:uncharacterized protein n=1 Tax=Palaemon carinicauda TaxID=392227 RepID=UPI0035B618C4